MVLVLSVASAMDFFEPAPYDIVECGKKLLEANLCLFWRES